MAQRLFVPVLVAACLAAATPARAQNADADAEQAAIKFLVEDKGLATRSLPQEQWLATYAGPYWTSATGLTLGEKDESKGELRRFEIERITSRDADGPQREFASWWVDAAGALVKGERRVFDEGAAAPRVLAKYEFASGRVRITLTTRDDAGVEKTEKPEESALPAAFVPDHLLVLALLPPQPGKTWKFSSWGGDGYLPFTVTDQGTGKVVGRKGEVTARKLRLKNPEGEATAWFDSDGRLVLQTWASYPNFVSVGGTDGESRLDWILRPADDADAAGDRLVAGPAAPDKLVGELAYTILDDEGHARETFHGSLTPAGEGKTGYHYLGTTAPIASGSTGATTAPIGTGSTGAATAEVASSSTTVEEWWLAADGSPISGTRTTTTGAETHTMTAKADGKSFLVQSSDPDKAAASFPVAARFTPDALFLLRALVKEDKGSFRFSSVDLAGVAFSVYLEIRGLETFPTHSGEGKAKRHPLAPEHGRGRVLDRRGRANAADSMERRRGLPAGEPRPARGSGQEVGSKQGARRRPTTDRR